MFRGPPNVQDVISLHAQCTLHHDCAAPAEEATLARRKDRSHEPVLCHHLRATLIPCQSTSTALKQHMLHSATVFFDDTIRPYSAMIRYVQSKALYQRRIAQHLMHAVPGIYSNPTLLCDEQEALLLGRGRPHLIQGHVVGPKVRLACLHRKCGAFSIAALAYCLRLRSADVTLVQTMYELPHVHTAQHKQRMKRTWTMTMSKRSRQVRPEGRYGS